jgi:hypothetical protein
MNNGEPTLPDSVKIRRELAKKGQLACPKTLNYRLDTKAHTISAMAYYNRANTIKCKGGKERICKAYRRFRLTKNEAYKENCK